MREIQESRVRVAYSKWHKSLGVGYHMLDFDSVECRGFPNPRIVALVEVGNLDAKYREITWLQRQIWPVLKEKLDVPLYYVLTDEKLTCFLVQEWPYGDVKKMTEAEYKKFLRNLGRKENERID